MPTDRLYFDDPLLLDFKARVLETVRCGAEDRPSLILDRSAFYPESGGQMADRGDLAGLPVHDVQIDEAGRVHHEVDGPLPPVGTEVRGSVDRRRRRLHMALHTGQHILSQAVLQIAGAATRSSRLGETVCTLDLHASDLSEGQVAEAERLANQVVEDDLPVRARFVEPAELHALELRRQPKVSENIRVVEIGGFDRSPCGGTHCTHTAQVGWLRVSSIERYKGLWRVSFHAGRRAFSHLAERSELLAAVARELTCGPRSVPDAVAKIRREAAEARATLGSLRERLAERLAAQLLAAAPEGEEESRLVVAGLGAAGPELLRAVAARVCAQPRVVALLSATEGAHARVLAMRGAEATFDCGIFLRRAVEAAGGRGGGRAQRAEGRIPATVDWCALVRGLL